MTREPNEHEQITLTMALVYAQSGIAVFPCHPKDVLYPAGSDKAGQVMHGAKAPRTVAGWKDATTDEVQIRRWWKMFPDSMIGAPVPEGMVCLDFDPKHQARLDDFPEDLPVSRAVSSGRGDGGMHVYLRRPEGRLSQSALDAYVRARTGRESVGWDLRDHDKHYLIMPPSVHPDTDRPYQWINMGEPDVMPAWLHEALTPPLIPERPVRDPAGPGGGSITDFNLRGLAPILEAQGWQCVRGDGESDGSMWRHPTATAAQSASVTGARLYNYSTSTGLPLAGTREGGQSPFDLHVHYAHAGDMASALREICGDLTEDLGPDILIDLVEQGRVNKLVEGFAEQVRATTAIAEEDAFWSARQLLTDIRRYSLVRGVSPWAVLGHIVVRALAATTSNVMLPPIIGSRASLNAFLALVGPSGSGKSVTAAVSTGLVSFGFQERAVFGIGSGEGLTSVYLHQEVKNGPLVRNYLVDGAIFTADEVDSLAALGSRNGATLTSFLRTAWSGGMLSQTNADQSRNRRVDAHDYRLALIVGVQPTRASSLLDDGGAGTPQRFFWMPTTVPGWDFASDEDEAWALTRPTTVISRDAQITYEVKVCRSAREAVRESLRSRANGTEDGLNGHALLARLKLAAGLSILDGVWAEVSEEWWALSGVMMTVSDRTRQVCIDGARQGRVNEAKLAAIGRGALAAESAVQESVAMADRITGQILAALEGGPLTTTDLNRKFAGRDKRAVSFGALSPFQEVLEQLLYEGRVEGRDVDTGARPVRWYSLV